MVRAYLQSYEQGCQQCTPQPLATVYQHHAGNGGRNVGQCQHLPDVSGCNDDEEVGRECPQYRTERCHPGPEVEGTQQQIEAQQHDEYIVGVAGDEEPVGPLHPTEHIGRFVAGRHLVGGHTTEQRVGPAGTLAGAFHVLLGFLTGTDAGCMVVLSKHQTLHIGRVEIDKRNDGKQGHRYHVGQQSFH